MACKLFYICSVSVSPVWWSKGKKISFFLSKCETPPPTPRILPHLWIYCLQSYSSLPLSGWLLSFNLIIYFSCGRLKIENFWYYPLAVKVLWLGATFYETCKSKLNIEWLSLVFLAKMSLEYLEEKTREFGISDGYRTNVIKVSEVKFWIICVKIVQLGFGSTFNFLYFL